MLLEGEFAREQLEHADAYGPDVAREVDLLLDAAPAAAESGVIHSTDTRRESAKPPGVSVSAAAGATHATTHTWRVCASRAAGFASLVLDPSQRPPERIEYCTVPRTFSGN